MKRKLLLVMVAFLLTGLLAACGSYYKVTEATTEKVYYTKDIKEEKSGAIKFKDAVTEEEVTIQNSEVMKISKDEFKMNTMEEKTE